MLSALAAIGCGGRRRATCRTNRPVGRGNQGVFCLLYRVLKSMTLGRFPNGGESDSTRRTEEVRHVGSDTITPGF
jgi:hypothetical protein